MLADVLLIIGLVLLVAAAALVSLALALLVAGAALVFLSFAFADGRGLPWRS